MRRVVLLLAAMLLLAPVPAQAQSAPADDVRGAQVLVVGIPGLRWSDVDASRTPALQALAQRSAVGALSVKALPAVSCPADGWLTLGAGQRAEAFDVACGALDADDQELARRNADSRDAADVGALAQALQRAGSCLSARGPGAQLAGGSAGRSCPVLLLDGGTVGSSGAARDSAAAAADALVAAVDAARDEGSTLLVVGLSQGVTDDVPHLQVALAAGELPVGALRSASTRRAPYVQLVDVAPTVLELLDVPVPPTMAGQPWQSVGTAPAVSELVGLERRADAARETRVPFYVVLLAALLVALVAARVRRSWRVAEMAGLATVAAVAGSYVAGALPWWRTPLPLLALLGVVTLLGLAGAVAASRVGGPVGPAGAVCGALALLLVVDLLTGAWLQIDTPAGYSPLVAGRFAGIGNVAFGVLAAAVLLSLAAATHRLPTRRALLVLGLGGLLAVVVDGAPPFGSDVGGVLALVPALALLAMLRTGARVSVGRLAAAALAGVATVSAFALADWSRAATDRTHLGRFVEQVVDGTAGAVLRRKADAVLDLLFANAATAALPLVVVAAVVLVARPPAALRQAFRSAPAWRHGLLAVGVVSAVGFVVNDSGPAVPALALLVAGPATLAVAARVAASRAREAVPDR